MPGGGRPAGAAGVRLQDVGAGGVGLRAAARVQRHVQDFHLPDPPVADGGGLADRGRDAGALPGRLAAAAGHGGVQCGADQGGGGRAAAAAGPPQLPRLLDGAAAARVPPQVPQPLGCAVRQLRLQDADMPRVPLGAPGAVLLRAGGAAAGAKHADPGQAVPASSGHHRHPGQPHLPLLLQPQHQRQQRPWQPLPSPPA